MSLKRIAVLGEIGSGNVGDDYGYVLLRNELQAAFDALDVLVDVRPLTPNLHHLLASYHWDAVVTGCGTLLDQAEGGYVQALVRASEQCAVAILGSGVSDPRHLPPTPDGKMLFADLIYKRARYAWLRATPPGYEPALAGPDPMWLHGWRGRDERGAMVGINVGYAGFSTLDLDPGFLATLRSMRSLLREDRRRTILLSAWHEDDAWLRRLREPPGEQIAEVSGTQGSLAHLNDCAAVVATRIHLGVLAACHGVLAIIPDYSSKVREVFAATDVPFVPMDVKAGAEDYVQALDGTPPNRAQVVRAQLLCRQRVTEAARALAMGW